MRPDRLVPGDTPPGAPALAARGPHPVGVRTLTWRSADALDVQATVAASEPRRGPRELTVEAWYPAAAAEGTFAVYRDHLGRGLEDPERPPVPFQRVGRAIRDAPAARSRAPLVVVSHGYPGSRYLLSWLGEHLASKGYAVLAPDHTGSTHADMAPALEALYHRPLDIAAVLDAAAAWDRDHPDLAGAWDPSNAALAGYSLGGYGALVALGAGLAEDAFDDPYVRDTPLHGEVLSPLRSGDPFHDALVARVAPRVRAAVLFAPWGGHRVWDARSLAFVRTPLLIAGGSEDDVSDYDGGIRRVWRDATAAPRDLLTFELARHNVGPIPPPPEASVPDREDDWWHYADPVWDPWRVLGVLQHVCTAFLGHHLRGEDLDGYLAGAARASAATLGGGAAPMPHGEGAEDERVWPGFAPRTCVGLRFERRSARVPTGPELPGEDPLPDMTLAAFTSLRAWWHASRAQAAAYAASPPSARADPGV
jgi:predicted dienelactone hydrolase